MGRTTFSGPIRSGKKQSSFGITTSAIGHAAMWQWCDIPTASITGSTVVYPTTPIIIPARSRIVDIKFVVNVIDASPTTATLSLTLNDNIAGSATIATLAWDTMSAVVGVYSMGYAEANWTLVAGSTNALIQRWLDVNATIGTPDLIGDVKLGFSATASVASDATAGFIGISYLNAFSA